MTVSVAQEPTDGWSAELRLRFCARDQRTALAEARHRGPLRVQRPFYPEGDSVCHVYLLHPPGGIVGGDELDIAIDVDAGAAALVTTPAATKLYRSPLRRSRQAIRCRVAGGAALELLPQETIAFPGARATTLLAADVAQGARFVGWEIVALGMPALGETFSRGALTSAVEIYRDGAPLFIDRAHYAADAPVLDAAWGLAGHPVCGTMVCVGAAFDVAQVKQRVGDGACVGVSRVEDDVLIARYLGHSAEHARDTFEAVRDAVRPVLLGRDAVRPRIWAT